MPMEASRRRVFADAREIGADVAVLEEDASGRRSRARWCRRGCPIRRPSGRGREGCCFSSSVCEGFAAGDFAQQREGAVEHAAFVAAGDAASDS